MISRTCNKDQLLLLSSTKDSEYGCTKLRAAGFFYSHSIYHKSLQVLLHMEKGSVSLVLVLTLVVA